MPHQGANIFDVIDPERLFERRPQGTDRVGDTPDPSDEDARIPLEMLNHPTFWRLVDSLVAEVPMREFAQQGPEEAGERMEQAAAEVERRRGLAEEISQQGSARDVTDIQPDGESEGAMDFVVDIIGRMLERNRQMQEQLEAMGVQTGSPVLEFLSPGLPGVAGASLPVGGFIRPGAKVTNFAPAADDLFANTARSLQEVTSPRGKVQAEFLRDFLQHVLQQGGAARTGAGGVAFSPNRVRSMINTIEGDPVGGAAMVEAAIRGASGNAPMARAAGSMANTQRNIDRMVIERLLRASGGGI